MQPIDELGLTHQQNVLLCVAVLCLYGGGPVMCCALTVNRLLITVIIMVRPQSAPSQISARREHLLPKLKKTKKNKKHAHSVVLLLRCIDTVHQIGERVLRVNSKVMLHRPSCFGGKAVIEMKHTHTQRQ